MATYEMKKKYKETSVCPKCGNDINIYVIRPRILVDFSKEVTKCPDALILSCFMCGHFEKTDVNKRTADAFAEINAEKKNNGEE